MSVFPCGVYSQQQTFVHAMLLCVGNQAPPFTVHPKSNTYCKYKANIMLLLDKTLNLFSDTFRLSTYVLRSLKGFIHLLCCGTFKPFESN